jgi:DNA-binding transcriptional ArsR family regulator
MSRFAIVPTHWLENESLTQTDRIVLVALSSFADEHGYCWPSVSSIARRSGAAERTVQYSLKRLAELGAVRVAERSREQGGQTSNAYWLLGYDALPGVQQVQGGVQEMHPGGAIDAPGGVQQMHPNSTSKNRPSEATTTTTTTRGLSFDDQDHQQVYESYRRAHHNPTAFDATLRGLTLPMGGTPVSLEQVGAALLELAANNEGFNISRLRGYLRGLTRVRSTAGQSQEDRQARMLRIMEETMAARGIA